MDSNCCPGLHGAIWSFVSSRFEPCKLRLITLSCMAFQKGLIGDLMISSLTWPAMQPCNFQIATCEFAGCQRWISWGEFGVPNGWSSPKATKDPSLPNEHRFECRLHRKIQNDVLFQISRMHASLNFCLGGSGGGLSPSVLPFSKERFAPPHGLVGGKCCPIFFKIRVFTHLKFFGHACKTLRRGLV
jgi:hypothetical protein